MSNPVFLIITAGAVLLALAFVVLPLVGSRHRAMIVGAIVFVPAVTLSVYLLVGMPNAVDPDTGETGEIRSAVTELAQRALREQENPEHWARLGLAYKSLEEFSSAEHAFRRALYIDNDVDFIKAELGETLLYASGERQLPREARRLLEEAAETGSHKALWLLGMDAFQREAWPVAVDRFERLLAVLPNDSNVRGTVEEHLAAARSGGRGTGAMRGGAGTGATSGSEAAGEAGTGATTDSESAGSPELALSIRIDEALAEQLEGDETVFVAVRRPAGGPPLAVRRMRADQLPAELAIDDGDAMMAGSGLSSAENVVVTARVSFSGNATPAAGDFEGQSDILPVESGSIRAEVTIDKVR
ncbi:MULTISPECIES: hypothetical protein [unclassified Wenzhouxiangella]|uniref:tetratricopeptide repeat protein n=1 Tax=unclassified Wenzhouxiangella TaxID=2613841 RepID=UPI000E32D0B0|nr:MULTISPECIES: hypothetical protein [unclassified Wenzhouxiangella]RFF27523.1 hypothetical protein DZK25_07490 [Wenzhouxiangella sp. 15181]RFP69615.1 hypothetical protein DZK26_03155 [Wenzhouxiangella sp. 15190]